MDRIHELDSHCLLDYIQRPGRTMAEKAGRNQCLLGITRRETLDTLENRVLRDLLIVAEGRARDYARENSAIDRSTSKRIRRTESFRRQAYSLLRGAPLGTVGPVHGEVQPNYALLKDRRYSIVWSCWREFRREEKLRKELWRWSRRLWADIVRGWIVGGLHSGNVGNRFIPHAEPDALLRRDHDRGRIFLPDSHSARFTDRQSDKLLDLIHPDHFHLYPVRHLAEFFQESSADFAVTRIRPKEGATRPGRCLLVYTFLPLVPEELELESLKESVIAAVENQENKGYRALIVIGCHHAGQVNQLLDGRIQIHHLSVTSGGCGVGLVRAVLELIDLGRGLPEEPT